MPDQMAVTRWDAADAAAPAGLTPVHQDLRAQGADRARIALEHPSCPDPPNSAIRCWSNGWDCRPGMSGRISSQSGDRGRSTRFLRGRGGRLR
ncbi:hypothetical protein GCM10011374_24130 [Kocuria dechangensis]|uniref:Uncharacterized protein n=1 Tax=Kocuria dechangensis TaxID=1176249 RepID=A0A917LW20_9MICC|nr:hypothetical protein GCM10011374_24130 [Kocuria dechangensis]